MSEGKTPPPGSGTGSSRDEQRVRDRERPGTGPVSAGGLDMRIDAALGEWPLAQRTALDWDDAADRVIARIEQGDRGSSVSRVSDEDLFAPPLAASTEEAQNSAAFGKGGLRTSSPSFSDIGAEGSKMAVQSERRERRSFQELANMARGTTPPPPSVTSGIHRTEAAPSAPATSGEKSEDSGILDLNSMAAADPGASARAQATPLASSGLFEDEPLQARSAAPHSVAPQSQAPASAHAAGAAAAHGHAHAVAHAQPAQAEKKGGAGVVIFGAFAAVAAIAAGAFLLVKMQNAPAPVAAAPQTTATQVAPVAQKPAPAAPATTSDNAVDPTALPLANAPTATATAPTALFPFNPPPNATASASAMATASAPAASAPAPIASQVASAAPAPTSSASLEEQMRQAAGPSTSAAPTPPTPGTADPTPTNVPMKPSQGALSGAISAVMPSARQCLGPDDPISQASIVFQSNGTVQSVSITGYAAGKPAEACIRQALMRAKVAPFAQATFTTYATIRPN